MAALYAFCREVDDVADEDAIPTADRQSELRRWRADIRSACEHGQASLPVNRELVPVIRRFRLSFDHFDQLIRGVEMDLERSRYETFAELETYCYRVASVVGLLSIEIFGYQNPSCRDYAIALCLSGLGLRASEVARLTLDDVDWRAATIGIAPSKGRRGDCLPLPAYIAKALVDYLRHGRPETRARFIFVHHRAPLGRGGSASLVRSAVRLAYARVGLDARFTGTHVLRHTAATRILRNGGSMKEVADVLRHRSLDTSAIYAKVDLPMLADVALPWPGKVRS